MSNLRRYKTDCNHYFITNVTYKRMPILVKNGDLMMSAIKSLQKRENVSIIAFVVLSDHFHMLIDTQKLDISKILQKIKMNFGALYRDRMNMKAGRIWQNRFWDHIIRNQEDLNRHIDYIHYNPVKHGYAPNLSDWKYSSINKYKKDGYYSDDWGQREEFVFDGNYGE